MHVQLPKASLGIEPQEKGAPVDPKKPDREAARAILEMFQALADTSVCVFNTELEAQLARNAWSVNEPGGLRVGDVVGLDIAGGSRAARRQAKKKGGKKGKGKGFKSLQALDEVRQALPGRETWQNSEARWYDLQRRCNRDLRTLVRAIRWIAFPAPRRCSWSRHRAQRRSSK